MAMVNLKFYVVFFFAILLMGQYTMLTYIHQKHDNEISDSERHKNILNKKNPFFGKSSFLRHIENITFHQQSALETTTARSTTKSFLSPEHQQSRIAVVIPYLGPELPSWFPIFASSCAKSSLIADWIIFTAGTKVPSLNDDITYWLPSNIKFIELGISGLAKLHARLVSKDSEEIATKLFEMSLLSKPYGLVEFKPAIGHIFHSYLVNYSHWCFSDLDLIMGDLPNWVDEMILYNHHHLQDQQDQHLNEMTLKDWDIFTYSFGDQFRLYTRGQWTVHRNIEKVSR